MKKRIGTLTFHWATNYGAVLQAYALQTFLVKNGFDTEIIDYRPGRVLLIQRINMIRYRNKAMFFREKYLKDFRRKEIKLSARKYWNQKALVKAFGNYNTLIVGSDQIWNPSFTLGAEGKTTLSYFFRGAEEKCKRIGYAVSFGTAKVNDDYINDTKEEINKFDSISVRENSGIEILKFYNRKAKLVCDPTLLLKKEDYEGLISGFQYSIQKTFSYILHDDKEATKIAKIVKKIYRSREEITTFQKGMYEWLYNICYSEIVITNSFHGVMMSLIFNTEFIAVLIEGSGMNDRLITILKYLDLENRIVKKKDDINIAQICAEKIDWDTVNKRIDSFRVVSSKYLLNQIEG